MLWLADEAFFTGTAAEITPIREVDNRAIGEGKPGPVTQRIQKRFFDVVSGSDDVAPRVAHARLISRRAGARAAPRRVRRQREREARPPPTPGAAAAGVPDGRAHGAFPLDALRRALPLPDGHAWRIDDHHARAHARDARGDALDAEIVGGARTSS